MADINDLYLTDGIQVQNLSALIHFIYSHSIVIVLIYVLLCLYVCCKPIITRRSKQSADPTSTRPRCEQLMMKFFSKIERWTAWLLVDLFHTPKVEKEMKNEKLYLKVGEHGSLELEERPVATGYVFACISLIFCLYIDKLILDIFVEVTPTCIDTGDFGVNATCYVLNTTQSDYSNTTEPSYPINCTTWNSNFESFDEEIGLLFCFSFYYNILTSMAEIVGMFALQTFIIRVILSIVGKVQRCRRCCVFLSFAITIIIPINITIPIIILSEFADLGHKKRYFEIGWKLLTPTLVAMLSLILPIWLLMSTEDSHKTENTETASKKRNDYQSKRFPKKGKEEQSNGETNPFLTEESPQSQYQSIDDMCSETLPREVLAIAEIHPRTTAREEVHTTTGCTIQQAEETEETENP